ncbi:MAG TPA: enoyl-CoA hydratase-related protein [Caulobacteraceae bacterium]|nr:enoyl-CoA hydratase-related protein [Caulobacteraceae bacterium]
MAGHLIETFEGGVATLTMNRPEARNALTSEMQAGLSEALPRLAADRNVRAVVVTGAGGAFCAGGDVKGFAERTSRPDGGDGANEFDVEQRAHGLRASTEVCRWLHEMPKPTLAVIPGPAAGAGLSIALACDLRIAAADAKLTTAFSKVGLAGDYGGSYFLSHLVGGAKARELYFTADVISGEEALRLGIVNRIASREDIQTAGKAWALELAALPTLAIGYMKRNLNAAETGTLPEILDIESFNMVRTMTTADHRDAAAAFVAKRKPVFQGR